MPMTPEWNDEEWTKLLAESDEPAFREGVGALPEWLGAATERSDAFWRRQQVEIGQRIRAKEGLQPNLVPAFAGALAVILLALVLLHSTPRAPIQAETKPDQDQELLIRVERAVGSDTPAALEPAALLAEEINNSMQASHRLEKESPK